MEYVLVEYRVFIILLPQISLKHFPLKKKEEYGLFFTAWAPHDFSTNHLSHLGVKSRPLVLPNLRAPFIQLRRMKLVETEM